MQRELVSHTNPNYLHGCYPLDLSDYFGESHFSLIFKKPQTPAPCTTNTQPTCFI
jgi:hypothetical protein